MPLKMWDCVSIEQPILRATESSQINLSDLLSVTLWPLANVSICTLTLYKYHGILHQIPYSRKLSREKTFMNFAVLEPPTKVSPRNLGMPYSPMLGFSIPRNSHFLQIRESFLPWKFPAIWYFLKLLFIGAYSTNIPIGNNCDNHNWLSS